MVLVPSIKGAQCKLNSLREYEKDRESDGEQEGEGWIMAF